MCGRFTITVSPDEIAELLGLPEVPAWAARWNVAPTQELPVVLPGGARDDRTLARLRWGLVPSWAKDPSIGSRMINARAESLLSKNAFADALRKRRCLVPADGFYEWRKLPGGRHPVRFVVKGEELFGFAGLWDSWRDRKSGRELRTFTIITTTPNELVAPVHDRMPALLVEEAEDVWLDPAVEDPDRLLPLLAPYPAERMAAYDVSPLLNSPENDGPEVIARTAPAPPAQLSLF